MDVQVRDEIAVPRTEPIDAVVAVFHVGVADVETDRRTGFTGQIPENRQLEATRLVTDVLDDEFDAGVRRGIVDSGQLLREHRSEIRIVWLRAVP